MIDRSAFARDGFVTVPGVVGDELVNAASRAINSWFANGFDRSELATYAAQSFAPELTVSDEIVGLCTKTHVLATAEALVGQSLLPPTSGQIALRFPTPPGMPVALHAAGAHIDGLPAANNGVPNDGRVHTFTVLAGVFLNDVPAGAHGNFTVWPGSHREMAAWFRANGTHVADPEAVFDRCRELSEGPGVRLAAHRGDVVFAHHLLVHTVAPHGGADIRYAVFFRLRVRPWGEYDDRLLTDPWHEYLDVRE